MSDRIDIEESRRIMAAATKGVLVTSFADDQTWVVTTLDDGAWVATFPYFKDLKAYTNAVNTLPLALDEIEAKDREIERLRNLVRRSWTHGFHRGRDAARSRKRPCVAYGFEHTSIAAALNLEASSDE